MEVLDQLGKPVVADAGHVVMTKGGETLIIEKSVSDIADDLSWRGGVLGGARIPHQSSKL